MKAPAPPRFLRLLWLGLAVTFLASAPRLPAAARDPEMRVQDRRAARAQHLPADLGRGLRLLVATYDDLAPQAPRETRRANLAMRGFSHVQRDARSRVLADIYLDGSRTIPSVRRQIKKWGGQVTAQVDWYRKGLLTAWIPIKRAGRLAATYGISTVNLAVRPRVRVGKATSQGVTIHRTAAVNTSGYSGGGVTIGVISDSYDADTAERSYPGFTRASADVTSGDLPGTTNPKGHTAAVNVIAEGSAATSGASDEGRAMLQIVHDVAPAAKLAFATCGASESAMATNIGLLQSSAGCKVICDDIVFFSEPMFSDGVIAQAVDRVTAKGVTYFSAAGNDGNSGYTGDFNPVSSAVGLARAAVGGVTTSGIPAAERNVIYQWHGFGTDGGGNPIVVQTITTGSDTATLNFQWDDPFDVAGGVTADFDILVFTAAGVYQSTLSGTDENASTREPLEIPSTDLSANTTYKICIVLTSRIAGSSRKASHLRYVAATNDRVTGDYITASSPTTYGHCCAATAMGVGAFDYDVIGSATSHTFKPALEDYSSNGPAKIYFDSAGHRLATGILRKQPAISAVDNVDTTFFPPSPGGPTANDYDGDGYPNFAGTSAAAPHAAAIAALLVNAASVNGLIVTPADIRTILINTAQKTTDQDPNVSTAVAGPITITANGDAGNASAASDSFFQVSFTGAGSSLTQITIDLSPVGLHFDPNAAAGHAFAVGAASGTPTPAFNGTPALSAGASSSNAAGKATINLKTFGSGGTLTFGVDRDEDLTSAAGNSADEIGGPTVAGGGIVTATVDGITYSGTFVNRLSGAYNDRAGYGLIDAVSAVNYLLLPR